MRLCAIIRTNWATFAKSSAPSEPAASWRRVRCARGWRRNAAGANRPSGSATTCVENCTASERSQKPLRRPRSSRVGLVSPTSLREGLRRPHSGDRGGGGCSEDRRSMQNDKTAQDARRLLVAFSTNHAEARMVSPYGLDRPFSPSWADAEQAGLDRVRRDAAMWWLVDNNLLEREEEAENQRSKEKDLPDYDYVYGSVFRITNDGRELLEEIWEEQRHQ